MGGGSSGRGGTFGGGTCGGGGLGGNGKEGRGVGGCPPGGARGVGLQVDEKVVVGVCMVHVVDIEAMVVMERKVQGPVEV